MNGQSQRARTNSIADQVAELVRQDGGFIGMKPITLQPEVGEELAMFLVDDSPNMEELLHVEPLGLGIHHGLWRNMFGPVGWILKYLHVGDDPRTPIVASISCFNPHSEEALRPWRRLADQGEWHWFVVAGTGSFRCIDFDNSSDKFNLRKGLRMIVEEGSLTPMLDATKAEQLFRSQFSVEDLMNMPEGHSSRHYS